MKRISLCLAVYALFAAPGLAATTIECGPGTGGWSYSGSTTTLSFTENYRVLKGLGLTTDTLVDAYVHIPNFIVGGLPGGPYTLTPAIDNVITITDGTSVVTYLSGTLGNGYLEPAGTTGVGYVLFKPDITGITVNNTIGSAALTAIAAMSVPALDFELTLNGASGGFQDMLSNSQNGNDGFSGAMTVCPTVPAPGAILLGSLGVGLAGWLRRRRAM